MTNQAIPNQVALREQIYTYAQELELSILGITSSDSFVEGAQAATARLSDGLMGDLPWYTRERIDRGTDPRALLPGARSIISVAVIYPSTRPELEIGRGRVARYAWGRDYHNVLKKRLKQLITRVSQHL